ncbi:MAG: alpha/beta fold hydrolase [Opitutales bacterium]
MSGCAVFGGPIGEAEIAARLAPREHVVSAFASVAGRAVHRVETGNRSGMAVIFIHGSPGSWEAFGDYLADAELAARAHLISVDRPGFGASGLGHAVPDLAAQAEAVASVWRDWSPSKQAVVIGHSLGGPIAAQVSVEHPERVRGVLLLAPSVAPELETVYFYQHLFSWPPFRWLIPADLKACNDEILPLADELRELEPRWEELGVPVSIMHGTADRLVPVENVDFIEARLPKSQLTVNRLEGARHFLPWTHFEDVKGAILELLDAPAEG